MTKKTAIKQFIAFALGASLVLGVNYITSITKPATSKYEISKKDIDLAKKYGYVESSRGFFYHYPNTKEYIKKTTVYTYQSCDRITVDVRNTGERLFTFGKYNFLSDTVYYLETLNVASDVSLYFYSQVDISKYITCERNREEN